MHIIRRLGTFTLIASAMITSGAFAAKPSELAGAMSNDGLQKISVRGLDLAYALPGATLAGYRRVLLDPVQVAFDEEWDPTRTGRRMKLPVEEREHIRTCQAKVVQEAFVTELQRNKGYPVTNEAGPGALRVEVVIVISRVAANLTVAGLNASRSAMPRPPASEPCVRPVQ